MLQMPRRLEAKAKGVGTQVWKMLLKRRRKSDDGAQWAGREGSKAEGHCMVWPRT